MDIPSSLMPSQAPEVLNPEAVSQAPATPTPEAAPQMPTGPAYQMLQTETKHSIDVPHDDVYTAVKSGQYLPKKSDEFVIKDSNGEGRIVTGEYLKQALDQGFRLETSQEMHDRVLQEQHGSSQVATAIEGAARGALALPSLFAKGTAPIREALGLAPEAYTPDQVMAAVGIDPKAAAERAEANPKSAMIGNLIGTVGGAEAAGITKGAKAIEGLVAKSIIKDATKVGLGTKIAATLASKIAGSAVEGAYFGAGELITENSLGKADFNAENLASAVGMGTVIGGGLGAAVGIGKLALPGIAAVGKMAVKPFQAQAEHYMDDQVAAARLLGLTPAQVAKLSERNPTVMSGIRDYLKDDLQLSYADTPEILLKKNEALREAAGKEIGDVLKTMDSAFEFRKDLMPTKQSVWSGVLEKVKANYADWLSDEAVPGAKKVAGPVQDFIEDLERLSKKEGTFGAADLQKLKRMQDELMNYEKSPGKWSVFEDLAHTTRSALKDQIESAADKLHDAGTEDLAMRLREANRKFASASTFGDFIEKRALKAADKTITMTGAAKDVALDISRKLAVLGHIERAQQATSRMINRAVESFVKPASESVGKVPGASLAPKLVPASIIDSQFSKKFDGQKYKKPKDVSEAFSNMHDNFARYTNNPEAFTQRVNRSTASIYNQAPQTSQALDALAVSAATFLAAKLPKRQSAPGMLEVFNKPRPPSKYDLAKFERYMTAVEHPETVFRDIEHGRISSEAVEALQAVYPNLYEQLKEQTLQVVGANPDMPYSRKVQLGTVLGLATHESMLPENVLALQSNFQTQPEGADGSVKPSQAGLKELNVADRAQTDTQDEGELA